jgi:hypothetical protein
MSADTDTDADGGEFATVGPDGADLDDYGTIDLENGQVLVYSREHEDAWIQSDDYVDLGLMA